MLVIKPIVISDSCNIEMLSYDAYYSVDQLTIMITRLHNVIMKIMTPQAGENKDKL